MDQTPGILLLTADPETERAVSAVVSSGTGMAMGPICRTIPELASRLRQSPARIAVVDLDPAPEKTLAGLDPVIARFAETRFVVVSNAPAEKLLLEAMHIGARHVVAKEALRADLPGVLKRVGVNGSAKPVARGYEISILSAGGGCGATLLATNLAYELHLLASGATLLVDLDIYSGAVASYLNVQADYDLATVLSDSERLDGELIKSSSAMADGKLFVLLSPGAALSRHAAIPRTEHLPRLLSAAKESFDYTVIDAPRLPMEMAAQVGAASALVIVPFQLSVVGIRAARNLLQGLTESGVLPEHIMPIASRHRRRRLMIGLDEAAKALGRSGVPYLTNDFKPAIASANLGQPWAVAAKRSALRRDIERLARHIHTANTDGAAVAPMF